jgi:hypothetical protein
MRLHRGGDRQANRALHTIAVVRLRFDARRIAYMQRRRADGLSKKDVMRCLKRFIAREVFHDLSSDLGCPNTRTQPLHRVDPVKTHRRVTERVVHDDYHMYKRP